MPSNYICEECTEKTIQSYIFISNTKKSYTVLENCLNDLESKVNDISCTLDCEHNYENSNIMIVIEYDNETCNQLKELNAGCSTILTDRPIKVPVKAIKKESKQNNGPVIIPTQRVEKYPRTNIAKKNKVIEEKVPTPNVTLQEGKIVIEPLVTNINRIPASPRFNAYCCASCEEIFTTYRSLKEHEKAKHNTIIFKCRYCDKIYNSQQYLDFHYHSMHNQSRCRFCKGLLTANNLNDHLKEMHARNIHSCGQCELVYYTKEQLDTHCKVTHGIPIDENSNACVMCLKNLPELEISSHKCKFSCLECFVSPCIHYDYLMSYREQILNHAASVQCLDCDYTTKRKEHLIMHVNREHLDHHPFTCGHCGTQFYTKLSLKTHIMQFHQDIKCQYCESTFKNVMLLKKHRLACKLISRLHECQKCVASFDTVQELENHIKSSHSAIVFPCLRCNKEFNQKSSLEEHHLKVHNEVQKKKRRKMIECTLCDITFKNLKEMIEHEQLHDPGELYPCKVCPKSYQSLKNVYMHKQKHYTNKITCPGCKKSHNSSYYEQHKLRCPFLKIDTGVNPCDSCGKVFMTQASLKTHQLTHSGPIPCVDCGKRIKPASMKRHLEISHSSYIGYEETKSKQLLHCDACTYVTRKYSEYENHVNKVHRKIKPYICDICGKQFCGKSRLAEHMTTHSESKVCFCPMCNKKFANKVCLKMHLRRHTNENPYECNICFERFRSSSIMKTHRLKKHHDKTIACPLCDAMYHLVAEMRFHVKKTHWKSPEPFDYKKIVPEECYHLFQDRRLQKLGDENGLQTEYIIP